MGKEQDDYHFLLIEYPRALNRIRGLVHGLNAIMRYAENTRDEVLAELVQEAFDANG